MIGPGSDKKILIRKNTNTAAGGLLPAGRGRGPQPEHEGVQPGPLLMAALKRIPKRGPKRDPWKYEVLGLVALLRLYYF